MEEVLCETCPDVAAAAEEYDAVCVCPECGRLVEGFDDLGDPVYVEASA